MNSFYDEDNTSEVDLALEKRSIEDILNRLTTELDQMSKKEISKSIMLVSTIFYYCRELQYTAYNKPNPEKLLEELRINL